MKKHWFKGISIILSVLLLLSVLPMTAMAEKTLRKATPSDAEEVSAEVSEDGEVEDDIPAEAVEGTVENDLLPAETAVTEKPKAEETKAAEAKAVEKKAAAEPPKKEEEEEPDLAGTWTVDGVTTYQYGEDGSGALLLPEHDYPFVYTAEGGELKLEFESARIGEAVFSFTLEGDILTLIKEEEARKAEFVLERTD